MARRHLAFALAAGCQTAPAPRTIAVIAQVPDGELILTRTAGGCAAAGTTITVAGAEARGGTWRLAPLRRRLNFMKTTRRAILPVSER